MSDTQINIASHTPDSCPNMDEINKAIKAVNDRLDDGHARMCEIEKSVEEVKEIIEKGAESHAWLREKLSTNNTETAELLEIVRNGRGFFKTAGVIGDVIKWGLGLGAAVLGFWLTLKSGGKL